MMGREKVVVSCWDFKLMQIEEVFCSNTPPLSPTPFPSVFPPHPTPYFGQVPLQANYTLPVHHTAR